MGGCGCKKNKVKENQTQIPSNINLSNVQKSSTQTNVSEEEKKKLVDKIIEKLKK